ncbi:MAG: diaminopimelate decarboxylase, partial [Clostridia bacterium]|nr:diaminopimelate decarboxylase [Clostridia bacterium]
MRKLPFVTLSQVQGIIDRYPTPFHLYDEAGIRASARNVNRAFSWNAGFREYYAVKACPNPFILKILREEGCGVDCASVPELMLARAAGFTGD